MTTNAGPESEPDQAALTVAAFDALPAQVAVLDDDGTILETNRAWDEFGRQEGLPEADMVGENYLAVCDASEDAMADAAAAGIRSIAAGERREFTFEYPCHSPDEERWFTMRAIALPGPEGRVLVMHTNITERKQAELAVEAHNDTLETVASVLSHDLRNPLNVALARSEQIARDPDADPETVREHAEGVSESLRRMADIIDDAVVLAKETEPDAVESLVLARVARRAWANVPTGGEATLTVAESGSLEADESLLTQLLENLFRNAIDHGGPGVTVTVEPTTDGFAVGDDGPGIPTEGRDEVFEMGYTTNAAEGGTGMGLAIVRRIADAHDWTITVTESDGGGARFEFAT